MSTSAVGCASATPDASDEEEDVLEESTGTVAEELTAAVRFETFRDRAENAEAARVVIRSRRQYVDLIGHPPPIAINFQREWVLYYNAGVRRTGGYVARIERVAFDSNGPTLIVASRLFRPGENCFVTQAFTNPQVFARITRPNPRPRGLSWSHREELRSCSSSGGGTCGGIAGLECPGAGTCVDDRHDSCDPRYGADCGGVCRCDVRGNCARGYRWSSSPEVCGCVRDY